MTQQDIEATWLGVAARLWLAGKNTAEIAFSMNCPMRTVLSRLSQIERRADALRKEPA